MRFVEVAEVPRRRYKQKGDRTPSEYHNLKNELNAFMKMDVKIVRIIFYEDEYASFTSAGKAIGGAVKRMRLPVKVRWVDGDVYLVRTDI